MAVSSLTSVFPYARLAIGDGLDIWGLVGVGSGDLTLAVGEEVTRTDLSMRMGALGLRGEIVTAEEEGDFGLAWKSDALWVRTESAASRSSTAAGLAADDAFDAQARLQAELGYGLRPPVGQGVLTPYAGFTAAGAPTVWVRGGAVAPCSRWRSRAATVRRTATHNPSPPPRCAPRIAGRLRKPRFPIQLLGAGNLGFGVPETPKPVYASGARGTFRGAGGLATGPRSPSSKPSNLEALRPESGKRSIRVPSSVVPGVGRAAGSARLRWTRPALGVEAPAAGRR